MANQPKGDDRPSVVEWCTFKIDREELRKEHSPIVFEVLGHCNQLLLLHGARHSYLINSYAQLCKAFMSGDIKGAERPLADFREALEWAAPWNLVQGG